MGERSALTENLGEEVKELTAFDPIYPEEWEPLPEHARECFQRDIKPALRDITRAVKRLNAALRRRCATLQDAQ